MREREGMNGCKVSIVRVCWVESTWLVYLEVGVLREEKVLSEIEGEMT